jgi:hypothetical protein
MCSYFGERVPATKAHLALPSGVAALPDGGFLIADTENHLVRRVSPAGIIRTVAGRDPRPIGRCGADPEYGAPIYFVIRGPVRGRDHRPLVRARAHQPVTIQYETTYDVSVVFTIKRRSTVLARIARQAASGIAKTKLGISLSSGTYLLKLRGSGVAIAAGGEKVPFKRARLATLVIGR